MIKGTKVRLVHGSILNVGKMDLGTFDYIEAIGVLHHLSDPKMGLDALQGVLSPKGGIGMMLYAKHGRQGVYQAQAMARLLSNATGHDMQGLEMISLTEFMIEDLPSNHLKWS